MGPSCTWYALTVGRRSFRSVGERSLARGCCRYLGRFDLARALQARPRSPVSRPCSAGVPCRAHNDKGLRQGQGRRTQPKSRALSSKRLRICVPRWGANNQAPRAPAHSVGLLLNNALIVSICQHLGAPKGTRKSPLDPRGMWRRMKNRCAAHPTGAGIFAKSMPFVAPFAGQSTGWRLTAATPLDCTKTSYRKLEDHNLAITIS